MIVVCRGGLLMIDSPVLYSFGERIEHGKR